MTKAKGKTAAQGARVAAQAPKAAAASITDRIVAANQAAIKAKSGKESNPGLWFFNWKVWLDARRRLDLALEPLGLRSREYWLLAVAGAGDISQQEMAHLAGLDPSSLVGILDDLEKRGWVRRQRNPDDRRMQWVQRTEAGDDVFLQALPLAHRAEAEQLSVVSPAQQRQLIDNMRKLVTALK